MAVDFPNNPAVNELFFAEGTTWKWTGAAWAVVGSDGVPIEIVGADAPSGWQVWGDVLVQWGFTTTDATGNGGVTLQQPYKSATFRVMLQTFVQNAIYDVVVHVTSTFAGGFNFIGGFNGGFASVNVQWFTIGEAPDALKKPKVVQAVGGSELQEYHDPAGLASWRIVGTTLECWGAVQTGVNGETVTYPKTFKGDFPRLSLGVRATTSPTVGLATYQSNNSVGFYAQGWDYEGGVLTQKSLAVSYHAIGEWDGVS